MKIGIPAISPSSDSPIDQHFGRAKYFAIYDTDTNQFNFVENPGCHAPSGAGPGAVQQILNHGVNIVLAYRIGPKAKDVLDSSGIEFYETSAHTVQEAITQFLKNA